MSASSVLNFFKSVKRTNPDQHAAKRRKVVLQSQDIENLLNADSDSDVSVSESDTELDVTEKESILNAVEKMTEKFGKPPDIVVNSAGIINKGTIF